MSKENKEDMEMKEEDSQQQQNEEAQASSAEANESKPAAASSSVSKKKKGGKKEEPLEVDPNLPGQRFKIGELIYANYAEGKQWFEAKVLKVEKRQDLIYYYLHYQGWSDKYNDWRPYHLDSELMKHDEEGRRVFDEAKQKMKEAKAKTGAAAKNATVAAPEEPKKKSKRKADDDDTVEDEVSVGGANGEVKLKISGFLKKQLIADWENVTREHRLVTLPRPQSVSALLKEYEESKQRQESSHQMVQEVVHGLEQYFEKAIGTILLYRFERPQYKQWVAKCQTNSQPLAQIYGAEHLLRLFVKLPSLLACTKLETKEAVVLGSKLNDFIKWLDNKAKSSALFQTEYEATDKDYQQETAEMAD